MTLHTASKLIKGEARESLLGHLNVAVGANVLYALMAFGLTILCNGAIPGDGIVTEILTYVVLFLVNIVLSTLEFGLTSLYMNLQYRQEATLSDLFRGFRESSLQIIMIALWTDGLQMLAMVPMHLVPAYTIGHPSEQLTIAVLLLVSLLFLLIVSIWVDLTYALVWYILLDYPEMGWREVLARSRTMMKGNKRVLLYMSLSFLPLYLVSVVSLGIAGLWVKAYQRAANAAFYRGLVNAKRTN